MSEENMDHLLELTKQQKDFAATYLNEFDVERDKCIEQVLNWVKSNDDRHTRTDKFFIVRFLRSCKFDVDKAKLKLRKYHEQRAVSPEWFTNRDPFFPELQELLDLGIFLPLRQVDEEGRLIVIVRACVHDPKKHKLSDFLKVSMMLLDLAVRDHVSSSLYGIVAIHDMTGVQLGHALQITPTIISRLVDLWQSYPIRIRSIDYVNAPTHVNLVLNMFKQFMSKKLKERMHVHQGDGRMIIKKISMGVLPYELGGTEENYELLTRYWKKLAEDNQQWFFEDEKYKMKI
ncbi:retinol-binding protein pinta [Copidosoma floridanum]|uniref:retinol-binding protein pinta n=1 Tax=Copidosoma floridanum TaxID=29053 RepID=UPI0006C9B81B|nr:retinol-binding protein pinta [Copidosoma floridanum]